jgi:hypothetical protein
MEYAQLLAKVKDTPVLCDDGAVGLLITYPANDSPGAAAGVLVPGELAERAIPLYALQPSGEALRQQGAPQQPASVRYLGDGDHVAQSRALLAELWSALQLAHDRESGWIPAMRRSKPELGS